MSDQPGEIGRVVLFGESGFVGSNLLKHMRLPNIVAPSLDEADLTAPESLGEILRRDDIVINAAGYANATDTTARGRALFEAVNVQGVRNLAEACRAAGARQLVHISSVAAMGRWHGEGITEDMLKPPSTPYADSKLAGERILAEYRDDVPITILRPTSVFGEGRGLARTLCRVVSKGLAPLPEGGRAKIPFTYIGNIARTVELSLGNSRCFGRTFIVGDEESYPLREVVAQLAEFMGIRIRILAVPAVIARAAVAACESISSLTGRTPVLDRGRLDTLTHSVSYSIAAFKEATRYVPPYNLKESARRIVNWYMEDCQERVIGSGNSDKAAV